MESANLHDLAERYVQYCSIIRNYAPSTIRNYRTILMRFLDETGIESFDGLNRHNFEDWFFKGRLERKWSAATFRHMHKHLNTFMKWLVKESYLENNALEGLEKPKLEQRIPRTLTREQAMLVLDASYHYPYAYTFERYRNRALVGVMLLAGLRRGEALDLKLNDLSIENRSIFIRQGKGAKDRVVPMNQKLCAILQDYVRDRKRLNKRCIYLFAAVQGDEKLERRAVVNLIQKLKQTTKLSFSAHTLRHAFARLMLEGGCDIYTLSKIMGHSKITTTTIYLSCSSQQMNKSIEMHALN